VGCKLTVREDECGEGEVEDESELLPRRAAELGVDPVLNHPNDEAREAEEGEAGEPEAGGERLQEDPHARARVRLHRHHHRPPRLRERHGEVHLGHPARRDRHVADHDVRVLRATTHKLHQHTDR
jgi:hypothetical protein